MTARPGLFTHGTSHGAKQGCDCSPCKQARKRVVDASRARAREAIANGTYTGSHGRYCLRLGCRCEAALKARTEIRKANREQKAAKRAQDNGGGYSTALSNAAGHKITVLHYPPRGVGLWPCPTCGQVFPHRPPLEVEQAQLSA